MNNFDIPESPLANKARTAELQAAYDAGEITEKIEADGTVTYTRRRKPTIYEALAEKLGRTPTNAELEAECHRILFGHTDRTNAAIIEAWKNKRDARRTGGN